MIISIELKIIHVIIPRCTNRRPAIGAQVNILHDEDFLVIEVGLLGSIQTVRNT